MAGDVIANKIQLGDSATASNNFHIVNNVDGSMSINRGNVGSPLGEVLTVKADGTQSVGGLPSYHCRAWISFNGISPVSNSSIRSSGNVQSISRTSTGVYVITFTTPMPDANYNVVGTGFYPGSTAGYVGVSSTTTTSVTIQTVGPSGSATDLSQVHISIFR